MFIFFKIILSDGMFIDEEDIEFIFTKLSMMID